MHVICSVERLNELADEMFEDVSRLELPESLSRRLGGLKLVAPRGYPHIHVSSKVRRPGLYQQNYLLTLRETAGQVGCFSELTGFHYIEIELVQHFSKNVVLYSQSVWRSMYHFRPRSHAEYLRARLRSRNVH